MMYSNYRHSGKTATRSKHGWWETAWSNNAWEDAWEGAWEDGEEQMPNVWASSVPGEDTAQLRDIFSPEHLPYFMYVLREQAFLLTQTEEEKKLAAALLNEFEQKAAALETGSRFCAHSFIVGYGIAVTEEEDGVCELKLLINNRSQTTRLKVYIRKEATEKGSETETAATETNSSTNPTETVPEKNASTPAVPSTIPLTESPSEQKTDPKAITWTIGPKDRRNTTGYIFQRNDGSYLDMTQVYEFIQRESVNNPQLASDFPFIVVPAGEPAHNAPSFAIESRGRTSNYKYVFSPDYKKRWGLEKPATDTYLGAAANHPAIVNAPQGIRLHSTPDTADKAYTAKTGIAATIYPANTALTITGYATPDNPGWVKVRMANGQEGWIEQRFVAIRRPGFEYYTVQAGESIESIIKTHPLYKNAPYETGFDRRNIAEAIALLNQDNPGIYREGESDHWFLDAQDPYFKQARYNYDTLRVREGTTLVLPTVQQVQALQHINAISNRPEWMNWTIGIEKGIWGFVEGIGIGFAEAAVDMVTGIWDMISGIVTGKLFTDMIDMVGDLWNKGWEGVWEMIKGMWNGTVDSFTAAWNNPNPEEKWKFFGKIVGMILFEVVLAIITAGVGTAINAAVKSSTLVTKLPKLVKVIDALTPEVNKVPKVDKDRLARKADVDVKLKKINDDIETKKNPKAKEFEKNVDDNTHKKLDDDARKEVDDEIKDDPKKDEKLAVLMAAKVIAEGGDIAGADIGEVMAQLFPLASVANVRFESRLIVAPNYSIHMIGSDLTVDASFSSGEKGKSSDSENQSSKNDKEVKEQLEIEQRARNRRKDAVEIRKSLEVRGFKNAGELVERLGNLRNRLKSYKYKDMVMDDVDVGLRGSSVTNVSSKTGKPFQFETDAVSKMSDMDFFFSSKKLEQKLRKAGFDLNKPISPEALNKFDKELSKILNNFATDSQTQLGRKSSAYFLSQDLLESLKPTEFILR